jgi:divalent metal cation (Fe/Co/Zn/Cd) transporter
VTSPGTPESESVGTVLVAGAANLAISVAKLVAGLISGSAAMLSEAAHSLADTVTEVFLYVALRRGAKPADEDHPFGYGKESWIWASIAAIFTFVGGAGFSIYHGVVTSACSCWWWRRCWRTATRRCWSGRPCRRGCTTGSPRTWPASTW